ncbi:MAG TPA: cytochrome P450, partial [Thermomicrobiales bacterium]|nr:cytochrome P450 [Thermomicrobiales bacterium]
VLFDEVREILCRTACRWAGVPLPDGEVPDRTREFGAMIENSGRVDPRNWWALMLRRRNERWVRDIIERARDGRIEAPEGTPLSIITSHRDADGNLLDTETAAVELINILRPITAVARFIVFEAVALHRYPDSRELVRHGGDVECFVQEVRRHYPFFPFIGGRARGSFEWQEHRFSKGDWVLLDLYGTNHDRRIWEDPDTFRPERFRAWDESPWTLVPQGAGEHATTHRCPGEWVTIALMEQAASFLARAVVYDVPAQDLTISLSRMPAIPKSGLILSTIRRAA